MSLIQDLSHTNAAEPADENADPAPDKDADVVAYGHPCTPHGHTCAAYRYTRATHGHLRADDHADAAVHGHAGLSAYGHFSAGNDPAATAFGCADLGDHRRGGTGDHTPTARGRTDVDPHGLPDEGSGDSAAPDPFALPDERSYDSSSTIRDRPWIPGWSCSTGTERP